MLKSAAMMPQRTERQKQMKISELLIIAQKMEAAGYGESPVILMEEEEWSLEPKSAEAAVLGSRPKDAALIIWFER